MNMLHGLIAQHFQHWRVIRERLSHWPPKMPKGAGVVNLLTGQESPQYDGPWYWPNMSTQDQYIPAFGCSPPDYANDPGHCFMALQDWALCSLGGGNGKNRAMIEIAGCNDVRVHLCREIEVSFAEGCGPTLCTAFLCAATKALIEHGLYP